MADCLHITNIRAYGYVGLYPEEQTLGQWFSVNLTVWLDLTRPAQTDEITHTYDYSVVAQEIQTLIQTMKFKLIERMAGAIADHVLQSNLVEQVQVCLTKERPAIPNFMGSVTVDITRTRSNSL
ncbi:MULTISPECIES: dihydroneopterin aldolase [unclassified Leptolyngbya]|uniref:dihydroneopterin aldolase n=1 Tax=unclassified Leptolyngbya TaxID=2650499 RepID=UPI001687C2FC|nr:MULTISPECIES: dihydroneopterin aldolase [unclassified Leptolyngbya]MBD1911191.1 dihydroneopterin aldolase [Leptolyngbya sp. FACHB-8]MBD2155438.1 dihydroneopterin aldolase [Leptolyngbya sp. FACHB-16]